MQPQILASDLAQLCGSQAICESKSIMCRMLWYQGLILAFSLMAALAAALLSIVDWHAFLYGQPTEIFQDGWYAHAETTDDPLSIAYLGVDLPDDLCIVGLALYTPIGVLRCSEGGWVVEVRENYRIAEATTSRESITALMMQQGFYACDVSRVEMRHGTPQSWILVIRKSRGMSQSLIADPSALSSLPF
jgi:hypothetical protein